MSRTDVLSWPTQANSRFVENMFGGFWRNHEKVAGEIEVSRRDHAILRTLVEFSPMIRDRIEESVDIRALFREVKNRNRPKLYPIPTYAMHTHWAESNSHHQRTRTCHIPRCWSCIIVVLHFPLGHLQCLPVGWQVCDRVIWRKRIRLIRPKKFSSNVCCWGARRRTVVVRFRFAIYLNISW